MALYPDHTYSFQLKWETPLNDHQNKGKDWLKRFAEHLSPVFTMQAYCITPTQVKWMFTVVGEEACEHFLKSENKLDKKFNLFDEAAGQLLLGSLLQNTWSSFTKSVWGSVPPCLPVEPEEYLQVITGIHLLPVHQGCCPSPDLWLLSSYAAFLSDKPTRLPRETVITLFGGTEEYRRIHQLSV
ncbi:MAG TPA: hypothetical protein VFV37_02460 [Luteibaculaceae bacterium]|jgi:putative transposase|nr:hypothetical protein [Luteibaculaceae bacterium]